jgi:hypothetical protein
MNSVTKIAPPRFGDVVLVENSLVVATAKDEGLLMSEHIKYATQFDMLVEVCDRAMVAHTDLVIYLNGAQYPICGRLSRNDKAILKSFLLGHPLPADKKGKNQKNPLKSKLIDTSAYLNRHLFEEV